MAKVDCMEEVQVGTALPPHVPGDLYGEVEVLVPTLWLDSSRPDTPAPPPPTSTVSYHVRSRDWRVPESVS